MAEYICEVSDADAFFGEYSEKREKLIRCKDCKFGKMEKNGYTGENGFGCYEKTRIIVGEWHESSYYCADAEGKPND